MTNYKNFDEMARTIKSMGAKWEQASENTDKKNTYAGIHRRMIALNVFLNHERKDMLDGLTAMRETYSDKLVAKKRTELEKDFNELSANLVKDCRAEVKKLTDSKRENIAQMLSTAPSDNQLRLLQVLQMRSDLTDTELQNVAPVFFDNYNAMKVLQNIGTQNGIALHLPEQLDARAMYEHVTNANAILSEACNHITDERRNIPLQYHAFFDENPRQPDFIQDPTYRAIVAVMDSVPQLQDVKAKKTELTPTEKRKIEYYYKGVGVTDAELTQRTREIMAKHPEDVELLKVSDYKEFVAEAENTATNA